MMDAGLFVSGFYFLDFLVSLAWVFLFRVGEKDISIPKNDYTSL